VGDDDQDLYIECLERECKYLREQLHDLSVLKTQMTSAATSAAASAVRAIEEIQEFQKVVDAAVAWRTAAELPVATHTAEVLAAERALREAVDEHLARVQGRS